MGPNESDLFAMLYIAMYFAGLTIISLGAWYLGIAMHTWLDMRTSASRKYRVRTTSVRTIRPTRYTLPDDRAMLRRKWRS